MGLKQISNDGSAGAAKSRVGSATNEASDGAAEHVAGALGASRKPLKISTVSHTLDAAVAERLRHFAFRERISESAVIEFALRELFGSADDAGLGDRLRSAGAALRRKT